MGTLVLVGCGLWDERDLSLRGLAAAKAADVVYLEAYTSVLMGASPERLERVLGRAVVRLRREDVEDDRLVREAKTKNVALLVAGDPLTATTHQTLRLECAKARVACDVVHGASIRTAVSGLLGLQEYKFGRTATLVFPEPRYAPESPYETIAENKKRGLHTLLLLDIRGDERPPRCMTANEGLRFLLDVGRRRGDDTVGESSLFAVVARAGSERPLLRAGPASKLADEDLGPPLHSLVALGELHFAEREALEAFAGLRRA